MIKHQNRILLGLLLGIDTVATVAAFLLAFHFRFQSGYLPGPPSIPPLEQYLRILPLVVILFAAVFSIAGLHKQRRGRSPVDEFFTIFLASSVATLLLFLSLLYYRVYHTPDVAPEWEFSRVTLAIFLVLNIIFVAAGRFVLRQFLAALRRRGLNLRYILIAGAGDLGRALVDRIVMREEYGLRAIGFLDDDDRKQGSIYQGVRVIGKLEDLPRILSQRHVDVLFIALPPIAYRMIVTLTEEANKYCIDVRVVPDLLQYISLKATVEDFDGLPVINFDQTPMQGAHRFVKRAFDITLSLIGLALTGLLFPVIALGIRLNSKGPVFYRQERMGLDGKPFTLYKFRTMYVDAERDGPQWATMGDSRATAFGSFLRRTSLDELPQFWNVLRGEMSLVGPRPERPEFVREFRERIPNYMLRHKVKTGMTGWAQVNGWRGDTSINKRIEYDLYYIQNWSMALDCKIIWLTLSRSMFGRSF